MSCKVILQAIRAIIQFFKNPINLRCHERFRVEGGSDQRRWVEDRQPGVSYTEAGSISDILHLLEETMGVHIGVGPSHPGVGVARLLLHRVHVVVAVLEITKLILSMELRV